MDVKEAIKAAKAYVIDIYEGEKLENLGLEEVKRLGDVWQITLGFSRPWNKQPNIMTASSQTQRTYRVVTLDDEEGRVRSMTIREPVDE